MVLFIGAAFKNLASGNCCELVIALCIYGFGCIDSFSFVAEKMIREFWIVWLVGLVQLHKKTKGTLLPVLFRKTPNICLFLGEIESQKVLLLTIVLYHLSHTNLS